MSTDDDKTGQRTMGLALFRSSGDVGFVLAPLVLGACSGLWSVWSVWNRRSLLDYMTSAGYRRLVRTNQQRHSPL